MPHYSAPPREECGEIRFARYQARWAPLSSVFGYHMWCQAHSGGCGSPRSDSCLSWSHSSAHYESTCGDILELGRLHLGVPCWSRVGLGEGLLALVSAFRVRLWSDTCSNGSEWCHRSSARRIGTTTSCSSFCSCDSMFSPLPSLSRWASPDPVCEVGGGVPIYK